MSSGTLSERPDDKIREVLEQYPEVCLFLSKTNLKGQLSGLAQQYVQTEDLLNGEFERKLRTEHGGGRYRIEARDPATRLTTVVPSYYTVLSGEAVSTVADSVTRPIRSASAGPSYVELARMEAAQEQAANRLNPSEIWGSPPDVVAERHNQRLMEELKEMRAKSAETERRAKAEVDTMRLRLEKQEVESRERAHKAEMEVVLAKIDGLRNVPAPKPALDATAIVGLATAFTSIVTAFIASTGDKQRTALEQQRASSEQQQRANEAQMQTFLALGNNSTVDILKIVVPALLPLLPKLLEGRDPSKIGALISSMAENQMNTISMVATSMQAMMGEPENPVMQMLRVALEGVVNSAQQASSIAAVAPARIPGVPATRAMQSPQAPAQPAEVVSSAPTDARVVGTQPGNGRPMTAPQIVAAIFNNPEWPDEYRQPEWKTILTQLHGSAPATGVGVKIAETLQTLFERELLPLELHPIFNDDPGSDAPSTYLRPIFEGLPISENAARLDAILEAIDSHIQPVDEDGEAPEEAEVDPADPGPVPVEA